MQICLGLIAISSIWLVYHDSTNAVLILSLQLVLLSVTYSIGSNYIESRLKTEYEQIIEDIRMDTDILRDDLEKANLIIAKHKNNKKG